MSPRSARRALLTLSILLAAPHLGCTDSAAEGATAPPALEAPEARVRVRTAEVRRERVGGTERVSGTVRAFHEATVTAETSGRIVQRHVERGDAVEAGDLLLELDASRLELDLRQAEATRAARETDLKHAAREYERGETLRKQSALSAQKRDDLRHALEAARDAHSLAEVARDKAKRMLEDSRITAPFAGSVDALHADVGDFVSVGTPVASVLDLSRVRVFCGVTAAEAARLEPGVRATASFAALGGHSQPAELRSVARSADPKDGTYAVELWIDDPDPRLRDGMVASLELTEDERHLRTVAPRAALLRKSGRSQVYVVERGGAGPNGVARAKPVRTGRTLGDLIEVLEGVSAGDEVVIEGHFALRDGLPVAIDGTGRAN